MEDKWFVFEEDGTLHLHRSWTGIEVYRIRFEPEGADRVAREAWMAEGVRTPWTEANDEEEARRIDRVFDVVLLGR